MKKKPIKISANEINRYTYCPYQWYYGKVYGQKALKEKYKALDYQTSDHEGKFKKGIHFHNKYYRSYRMKCMMQWCMIILLAILIIGGLLRWWQ